MKTISSRHRTFISPHIKDILEEHYLNEPYPTQEIMQNISTELKEVSAQNIKLWFQNRRAKERQVNPDSDLRRCHRTKSPKAKTSISKDKVKVKSCQRVKTFDDSVNYPTVRSVDFNSLSMPTENSLFVPKVEEVLETVKEEKETIQKEVIENVSKIEANTQSLQLSKYKLIDAIHKEDQLLVLQLLSAGFDVNERDTTHFTTPIMEAVTIGNYQIAYDLIIHGARLDLVDCYGRNVLHFACQFDHKPLLELLLCYYFNLEVADKLGFTPLQVAVLMGSLSCCSILVLAGADHTKLTSQGQSLSDLAQLSQSANQSLVIQFLSSLTARTIPTFILEDSLFNFLEYPPEAIN